MSDEKILESSVEGFLDCLNGHDWDGLADYLADPFVRVGGQADVSVYTPTGYVDWVKEILDGVVVYGKVVRQVVYSSDRRSAFAELIEFGGRRDGDGHQSAAVYVFTLDEFGRIERMALYQMPSVPADPAR